MKAYCVKCKDKAGRDMKDVEIGKTKKGGFMAKGTCVECSTKMCKMMSKDNAEKAVADGEAKKAY